MLSHISLNQETGTWSVRAGGAVIAESKSAIELKEGEKPPVMYFPRRDIAMAFLDASENTSDCEHKGRARLYSIETKSRSIQNAAWSYEGEAAKITEIRDYVAFLGSDLVTIERL